MRKSDALREVFFPIFVAGMIGSVWYAGSLNGDVTQKMWPAIDPVLSRRALDAGDASPSSPTTQPAITSISQAEQ